MNQNLNITQLKQAIQQEIEKEKEAHPLIHRYQDAQGRWHVFRTNIYDWKGAIPVVSSIGNKVKIDWVEPGPAWQSLITTKQVVFDPELGYYVHIDVYNRLHPKNQVKQPDLPSETIEKLNKLNEMSDSKEPPRIAVKRPWGIEYWSPNLVQKALQKGTLKKEDILGEVPSTFVVENNGEVIRETPAVFFKEHPELNPFERSPSLSGDNRKVTEKETTKATEKPQPKDLSKIEPIQNQKSKERQEEKPTISKTELEKLADQKIREIEMKLGWRIPPKLEEEIKEALVEGKTVNLKIGGLKLPSFAEYAPIYVYKEKEIQKLVKKLSPGKDYTIKNKRELTRLAIYETEDEHERAKEKYLDELLSPQAKALIHGIRETELKKPLKLNAMEALNSEGALRQKSVLFNLAYGLSKWEEGTEKWLHQVIPIPILNDVIAGMVELGARPIEGFLAGLGGWEIKLKREKLTNVEKELIGAYGNFGYGAEMVNLAGEGIGKVVKKGIEIGEGLAKGVKAKAGETLFGKIEIENIGKAEETIPAKPKGEIIELKPHVVEYLRNKAEIPKESERYGVQMSLEGTPADVEALEEFKKSLIERRFQDLLKEHLIEENMIKPEEAEAITLKPIKPEEVAKSRTTVIEKEKLPSGEIMEVPETYAQVTLPEAEDVKAIKVKRGLFGTRKAKVVEKISKIETELKPKIGQLPTPKESNAYLEVFTPKKTVQAPLPIEEPEVKVSYFPDLTPLKQKALEDLAKAQKEKWENAEILELSPSGETAKVRFVVKGKGKTYTFEELVPIDEIPEEKLFKFEEEQFGSEELLGGEGKALFLEKEEVPTKFEIVKEEPEEGLSLKRITREVKKVEKEAKEVKGGSGSLLLLAPPKQKQKEKQSLKLEDIYKQQLKLFEKFKPKEMAKMKLKVKQMQKQKTKQKTKTKLKAPEFSKIKNLNFTKNLFELNNLNVKTLSDLEVGSVIGTPIKTTTQPISTLRITSSVATNVIEELGAPFSPPSRGRRPPFGMIKKDSKGKQSKSRRGKAEWNIYNVFGDPLKAATSVDRAVDKLAKEFLRG